MGEQNLHRFKAESGGGGIDAGKFLRRGKVPELYGAPSCISRRGLDEIFQRQAWTDEIVKKFSAWWRPTILREVRYIQLL
jgi:hypothetical protein